jgi:hypothetical protein
VHRVSLESLRRAATTIFATLLNFPTALEKFTAPATLPTSTPAMLETFPGQTVKFAWELRQTAEYHFGTAG